MSNTIIILEDDNDLRERYSLALEIKGYKIISAENGQHILELIEKHQPILVITDLFMHEHSGAEAIIKIIKRYKLPIIAISAFDNLLKIVEPLVTITLKKPITDEVLITKVMSVLENKTS